MTTTTRKKTTGGKPAKASRKATATKKPLRVRPELLPPSATYATFEGVEYVMIPFGDFGVWYESLEDKAVMEYAEDDAVWHKPGKQKALLKIRTKHLPKSSRKVAVDKSRYIAVPVSGVQEWLEDIEDLAVCQYAHENPEPGIPLEEVLREMGLKAGKAER